MGGPVNDEKRLKRVHGVAVAWAVVSLATVCWSLATMQIDPAVTPEAGRSNLLNLLPFWAASASTWAALTMLLVNLRRRRNDLQGQTFQHSQEYENVRPQHGGREAAIRRVGVVILILTVAVAARVVVVITHEPSLSDDIWRYVFDGGNLAAGIDPYSVLPQDVLAGDPFVENWPGEYAIAARVNNDEMYTIYLPASQIVFLIAARVSETPALDTGNPLASARVFRGVFAGADVLIIILLLTGLCAAGRNPWWAALYAWHPLPLAEFAGSGHQDVIGIMFLVAALMAVNLRHLRGWAWMIGLSLAALIKPFVIIIAGYVLRDRSWREWIKAAIIGLAILLTLCAPFLLAHGGEPLVNLWSSVQRFSLKWAHFGSIYEPMLWSIEHLAGQWTNDAQEQLARAVCLGLVILIAGTIWWRVRDVWRASRMIFFAMIILSPTVHPWYLLWALVIVPMRPSASVWVASLTLLWSYAAWGYVETDDGLRWGAPVSVMMLAYTPIYVTLLFEAIAARSRARAASTRDHV